MKTMKNFLSMAALALMGTMMTDCSSDDNFDNPQQPENKSNVITLSTTVGFDASAGTRALTNAGVKTFAEDDQIAVIYKNTNGETVTATSTALTASDITNEGKNATFTVTLDNPKASAAVRYIYPAAMLAATVATDASVNADANVKYEALATQDGTLTNLASKLDLAVFDGALTSGAALPASASMTNQLAILAVTLKNEAGSDEITSSITGMTIGDGTNTYTVNRTPAAGPIYVAIRPTDDASITVTANDGSKTYMKSLTNKTYAQNNGYSVSWKMTDLQAIPLTIEAITGGIITVTDPKDGMQYSKNGDAKTAVSGDITVSAGDKVQFFGNGTSITCYDGTKIQGTAQVKAYGNIMSLVDETGFATATTLTGKYAFDSLFKGNTGLTDASGLLLPATTLTEGCYEYMFSGCTSLTAAPALPAETLALVCYTYMFNNCTSLTAAPALPAETLAGGCYLYMFTGCTSLAAAPALPATTLAQQCYQRMFEGCTSLTTAPALPATTLAETCYNGMFKDCTNLSSVTCLATDISAYSSLTDWLDGVADSGTFTKASTATWAVAGSNGIPDGWTVQNYVAP